MSDENSAISVTLKAGEHETPWVVIRGDTPEQIASRLGALQNSGISSQVAQAALDLKANYEAARGLGAVPVATGVGTWDPVAPQPPQAVAQVVQFPAQPQAAPAPAPAATPGSEVDKWGNTYTRNVPGAPTCPHGSRILKQGRKKDQSPYSAYICPQVDQFFRVQTDCKPIYS